MGLESVPFDVYRPASSAVGMYQITDGTFAEARRYCIKQHTVVEDGSWNDWQSCWFNRLYTRVIPSHAVELTAAYLDHGVAARSNVIIEFHHAAAEAGSRGRDPPVRRGGGRELCGHGLRLLEVQRCGDQEVHGYIARVERKSAYSRCSRQDMRECDPPGGFRSCRGNNVLAPC